MRKICKMHSKRIGERKRAFWEFSKWVRQKILGPVWRNAFEKLGLGK